MPSPQLSESRWSAASGPPPAVGDDILAFIKWQKSAIPFGSRAGVHYTAAHYYDPNEAAFHDFDPFWEFVSGPIHAGPFGPNRLDGTFGPQLVYIKAPTKEQGQNLSPAFDLQFFGHVAIDAKTERATATLYDWNNVALWSKAFEPRRA